MPKELGQLCTGPWRQMSKMSWGWQGVFERSRGRREGRGVRKSSGGEEVLLHQMGRRMRFIQSKQH